MFHFAEQQENYIFLPYLEPPFLNSSELCGSYGKDCDQFNTFIANHDKCDVAGHDVGLFFNGRCDGSACNDCGDENDERKQFKNEYKVKGVTDKPWTIGYEIC